MGLEEKKALLRRVHATKETPPEPAEAPAPPSAWGLRGNRAMAGVARVLFFLPLPLAVLGLAALAYYYHREGLALTPDLQYGGPIGRVVILGLGVGFFFLVGLLVSVFFKDMASRKVRLWSLFLSLGAIPLVILGAPGMVLLHTSARSSAYAALPHETIATECRDLAEAYTKAGTTLPYDADPTDGIYPRQARYLCETLKPRAVIVYPHGVVVQIDSWGPTMEGYYCPTKAVVYPKNFAEEHDFSVARSAAPPLFFFRFKVRYEFEYLYGPPSSSVMVAPATGPAPGGR